MYGFGTGIILTPLEQFKRNLPRVKHAQKIIVQIWLELSTILAQFCTVSTIQHRIGRNEQRKASTVLPRVRSLLDLPLLHEILAEFLAEAVRSIL